MSDGPSTARPNLRHLLETMGRGRRRAVLVTVLAVMTLAGSQALVAGPAAAEPARELPAPASEPAPQEPARIATGDFANPPPNPTDVAARMAEAEPAAAFDPATATAIEAETTPTEKVYAGRDGTRTAVVSARPARFRDPNADGAWTEFDLTLVPGPDASLVARAAPAAATLATTADGALATVQTPAGPITLHHPGAGAVPARTDGARATYPRALGDKADLVLSPTPDGYKEEVVLADASPGNSYVESFTLLIP